MIRRGLAVGACAAALALAGAGQASAALSCSYNASTDELVVTSSGFEEGVAIQRNGTFLEVTNDVMGGDVPCPGGPPTSTNTDTIRLMGGPGHVSPFVYFNLKQGPMAPGSDAEPDGSSEIEIEVDWADGFFGLGGTNDADRYEFGTGIFGPSAKLNDDADADVDLGSTQTILLRGEKGNDKLSGTGGSGFIAPLDVFMTIEGGPGDDKITGGGTDDVLYGEGGKDKVKGADGKDVIEVKGGEKDRVKCGAGKDKVVADGSDKVAADCEKVTIA